MDNWLERTELLLGKEKLDLLRQAHVLVVGLGGVGAYAAEMIARAGVGHMTIADADTVAPSNINRQLVALHSTVGRQKAEVLAAEMRAAWDFVDMNQDVINRTEDGTFRTKHLVCVVAAKSISMLFTTETDYSIRFTNDTPRQAANAPDEFEQEALAAFNADPERKAFWRVVDAATARGCFAIPSLCT